MQIWQVMFSDNSLDGQRIALQPQRKQTHNALVSPQAAVVPTGQVHSERYDSRLQSGLSMQSCGFTALHQPCDGFATLLITSKVFGHFSASAAFPRCSSFF